MNEEREKSSQPGVRRVAILWPLALGIFQILMLLCLMFTLIFWLRSYWIYERVDQVSEPDRMYLSAAIVSIAGNVAVELYPIGGIRWFDDWGHRGGRFDSEKGGRMALHMDRIPSVGGFYFSIGKQRYGKGTGAVIKLPYWFLAVMFVAGLSPAWVGIYRYRLRRRRALAGLCEGCGYDSRASGEFCPECGRRIRR